MPKDSQGMVDLPKKSPSGNKKAFLANAALPSQANLEGLQISFPFSPQVRHTSGRITNDTLWEQMTTLLLRGKVDDDGYWGFNDGFDRNYNVDSNENAPPSYGEIAQALWVNYKGGKWRAGDPSNPFMPNTTSVPGVNPLSSVVPPLMYVNLKAPYAPIYGGSSFIGEGTLLSPINSAKRLVSRNPETLLRGISSPSRPAEAGALSYKKSGE